MKRIIFVLLILLTSSINLKADHIQYLFEQANKLYEQNKYAEAIQKYEEILANGYESWELYYNLGNAYYKNKQLGKAILNYERAHRLANKNEDVKFNLELANLSVVDKIVTPPEFFLFKIVNSFKNYFNINILSLIVLLSYLLLITLIILRILIRKRVIRRLSIILGVPLLIVLIIFSATLLSRIRDDATLKFGIILTEKVDVMSSPEENSTEVFSLHEGVKVQVQKKIGDWLQIRLKDGKVGWLKKDVLEII